VEEPLGAGRLGIGSIRAQERLGRAGATTDDRGRPAPSSQRENRSQS
jgi:hypothetical protein